MSFSIVRRDGGDDHDQGARRDLGRQRGHRRTDPNYNREPAFSWDAYLEVPDPDVLAEEFATRGVRFSMPLTDSDDGLRGFVIKDIDGYGLFFGHLRA